MQKRPRTELVTVCRWQRSAVAEGRWGNLTKCGVTKLVTVHRVYDGPSCRFVMKFREVIQYLYSKSWSILEGRPSTDRCAYNGPSYLPSRVMKKSSRRNCTSMGRRSAWRSVVTMTIRREVHRPSRVLADFQQIHPCLIRFLFSINGSKNLIFEVRRRMLDS